MALPVAPLGSLPSMNMPYSRPYYEKTSAIDKALAAFLTGLAANTGGQIAENVMQRDFAADPAGFWSKLGQGPKQNRQQFEAQAGRTAEQEAQAARIRSQEGIAEADRFSTEGRQARELADRENARGVERTLFDLRAGQERTAREYEAARREWLARFQADQDLAQIGKTADERIRVAQTTQPLEIAQIEAMGRNRNSSIMPPWAQQSQTGVPTSADVDAARAQQTVRPITIEEARLMGLPEAYIRQLFPSATDTLQDIINPRGGVTPNLPPVVGSGQRR